MDEELIYPNPVARTDLPVKKKKWPRVVISIVLVLLLGGLFLPQILSSPIGRAFIKDYLAKKLGGDISLVNFSTSWRGGTSAQEIWVKNADGHVMGAHYISCDASLWKLLRGKFELGNCVVDHPYVDWVLDYGDVGHADTYSRMASRPPGVLNAPSPQVSGHVTVRGGTMNLLRAQVAPGSLQTTFRLIRFVDVTATFDAKTFVDPWQCDVTAKAGDDKLQVGIAHLFGTIGCGGTATFSPTALQLAMTAEVANVPASLLPTCLPIFTADDAKLALGTKIESLKLIMQASAGKLSFATFELIGSTGRWNAKPVIALQPTPAILTLSEPATFDFAIPAGDVRQELSLIQPFLSASSGGGRASLKLLSLSVPLDQSIWRYLSATGQLDIRGVQLATPLTSPDDPPKGIVGQLALLTGDPNAAPTLTATAIDFKIDNGRVTVRSGDTLVGTTKLNVTGDATADKSLTMNLIVSAPQLTTAIPELVQPLTVPLGGTLDNPRLDFEAVRAKLSASGQPQFETFIAQQLGLFRARQAEASKRPQVRAVENIIKEYLPTSRPATQP